MLAKLKINGRFIGRLRLVFHSLGLSCLGGAVFLQVLVFKDIATQGYFMGVEKNQAILLFEVGLTIFSAIYLLHLYVTKIRSLH
jgi:hypothetical protein